jgi:SulP family sulfate permease
MKKHIEHISATMRSNWKAGLTVALVSLPLSVSLAVASGATPTMGIIAAIWGGFFAALFGGSDFNIVGPTGALSGVIAAYSLSHGVATLPMLAVTTGLIIIIAWRFRLERFIRHIPEHTIHGFTIGVAVVIAATQLGSALGIALPSGITEQLDKIVYYLGHVFYADPFVFGVFAVFLVLLFLAKKFIPSIPGAIILSPFGILLGYLSHKAIVPFILPTLGDVFPSMTPKLAEGAHFFFDPYLIVPALGVAVIAIIETGVSATIADKMTGTTHNPRREVFGLALGNIASGIFGGIPATAALARTSLNIKSGADKKTAAMINAICIVVISFVFLSSFKYIPMAVIAAILFYVAYQLIERDVIAHSWKNAKKQFWIIVFVAAVCVYKDTIWGITSGVFIFLIDLGFRRMQSIMKRT